MFTFEVIETIKTKERKSSKIESLIKPFNMLYLLRVLSRKKRFKGVPIAKFSISTLEFGHETPTIGFFVPQNPGSDGRNYRFEHQRETSAIFVFFGVKILCGHFSTSGG